MTIAATSRSEKAPRQKVLQILAAFVELHAKHPSPASIFVCLMEPEKNTVNILVITPRKRSLPDELHD